MIPYVVVSLAGKDSMYRQPGHRSQSSTTRIVGILSQSQLPGDSKHPEHDRLRAIDSEV